MSLYRPDTARDANEAAIVATLRQIGASVIRLDEPCDLIVGYRGRNYLIEIKAPLGPKGGASRASLTPKQRVFFRDWQGQAEIARTATEALAAIGAITPQEVAALH